MTHAPALWCVGPGRAELRPGALGEGVTVDMLYTGISRGTERLVFEGRVLFCGAGRNCIRVPGGCNLLSVDRDSVFGEPENLDAKTSRISEAFPFAMAQTGLLPPFRTETRGCNDPNAYRLAAAATAAPLRDSSERAVVEAPAPEPPDPEPPDFNPAE